MKKPLILWGGTDIDARFYSKQRSKFADSPNTIRDDREYTSLSTAEYSETPVVGICRGAQMICAYNGGELYQHSEGHNQSHDIWTNDGQHFADVAADHHQIMIPKGKDFVILAYDKRPTKVWLDDEHTAVISVVPEVVWYPSTKMLAIQPHPEWEVGKTNFVEWINNFMKSVEIDYEF